MSINHALGVVEWYLPEKGEKALEYAADHGLNAIQIDFAKTLLNKNNREALLKKSQSVNVKIAAIAINEMNHLGFSVNNPLTKAQLLFLDALKAAKYLNVNTIFTPSFYENLIDSKLMMKKAMDFFKWACDISAKENIFIGTENSLGIRENLELYYAVFRPNFNPVFDTFNLYQFGEDPLNFVRQLFDKISLQIHLKNGTLDHSGERLLSEGEIDIAPIIQFCQNRMKKGLFFLENKYHLLGTDALKKDIAFVRENGLF